MQPNANELMFVDFVITCTIVFGVIFVVTVISTWFYKIWKDDDLDD